ncbi:MAG TPA: peptide chain release factor N(5)-glutamine methyltransferase [Ramlibacter sp.]|nr:peptide chain release factor N(5)-glutamine methyltransferase [Ramlibacter sp.]
MNVAQALAGGAALGLDRLDAQLLLLHVLGRSLNDRGWLLAHDTDLLEENIEIAYRDLAERRATGFPLAYIVGRKEFHGVELDVDSRVLVPRPDTETLVDWALELVEPLPTPRVIDLGTGSGAIALAIKHARPRATVHASDASGDALAVARANAQRLRLDVQFEQASWLDGIDGTWDLVVSNPPYVAEGDPHLAALRDEPMQALVSGPDGLDAIRQIVRDASPRLAEGGWLLLEHGHDHAPAVRALLAQAGFGYVASRRDLAGIERCTGAQWLESG